MSPLELDRTIDVHEPLPSQREMFQVIQSLAARCERLEQKVGSMATAMGRDRRKLDVCEWLKESATSPTESLWEWLETKTVTDTEFDGYTRTKLWDVLAGMLVGFVTATQGTAPIRAITSRPHDLYTWDGTAYAVITGEDMERLCTKLTRILFGGLVRWGERNERAMSRTEYCIEYARIAGKFSTQQSGATASRVKHLVCGMISEHAEMVVLET
jgi:hypothetical protein